MANYLYTKGREYSLGLYEYVGDYHISNGEPYTGPFPSKSSKLLKSWSPYFDVLVYRLIRPEQEKLMRFIEPTYLPEIPGPNNYNVGNFSRYFVKNRFEEDNIIIEIDQNQASRYGKKNGIDDNKYQLGELVWYISKNEITIDRIVLLNTTSIFTLEKNMPGVYQYLLNPFEYSYIVI